MYIKRHLAHQIIMMTRFAKVILITGCRQSGKSTILQATYPDVPYITMDNIQQYNALVQDPVGFFSNNASPLILDEIQRVGNVFVNLKFVVDQSSQPGQYFLTGSQKFTLMKNVADSLAGRISIMELWGLSNRELAEDDCLLPFLPVKQYLQQRRTKIKFNGQSLWERIHRGAFPRLWTKPEYPREQFYSDYINTYLSRDVRELSQVGNLQTFQRFMTVLAARCGMLLNLADLSRTVEIDIKTAKSWLAILQASNIVYCLEPFSLNVAKRVVKTPKIYFTDTGLVCYLCRWQTPEQAENGAQAGALFETFVINEIMKSYKNGGKEPGMYFFRDAKAREVDLLFYQDNTLFPVEIKKTASPNLKDVKNFEVLKDYFPTVKVGEGGIICTNPELIWMGRDIWSIPVEYV